MLWYGAGWRASWLACASTLKAAGVSAPWLFSYAHLSGTSLRDALAWPFQRFLDSGAFTAASRGTPIALGKYIAFCQAYAGSFHPYAALDVLGDENQTRSNLTAMRAEGLDPLPTWHITSSHAALRRTLSESSYFAIGGMVGMPTELRGHLLRKAWDIIAASPQLPRVHGFGLTRRVDMLSYPWHSIDSSTLLADSNFGRGRAISNGAFVTVLESTRGGAASDRRLVNSLLCWGSVMKSVTEHWNCHTYIPGRGAVRTRSDDE